MDECIDDGRNFAAINGLRISLGVVWSLLISRKLPDRRINRPTRQQRGYQGIFSTTKHFLRLVKSSDK